MCLIGLAWQTGGQRLLVAANRDEFYARPTAIANPWSDAPQVTAGRDLRAGGSWLGARGDTAFAAITNWRERDPSPGARSRGHLVADFLREPQSAAEYAERLVTKAGEYSGFTLLVADRDELWAIANRPESAVRRLPPGVYVLSNRDLDAPWPKSESLRTAIHEALPMTPGKSDQHLLDALADRTVANGVHLPDTGLERDAERALSSPFIQMTDYGTRCSTLLRWDTDGGRLVERSFDAQGMETITVAHALTP